MTASSLFDPSDEIVGDRLEQQMVQFIGPGGELTAVGRRTEIPVDLAQELYSDMVLARRFDHEALALQRQGELNLWLMSWGQEAAQVGSIRAMRTTDTVFPSYREHAAALCRGIPPADLMRQWKGLSHSGWDPSKWNFHIYSLVLGTQTLHAAGYAAAAALEQSDEVVLTYFGDGAASQGDVNEALNWAAVRALPVLFFCQNNQWAISTPAATQMKTPVHARAAGFGLDSYHVDGNDVMAVHAVTELAAQRIREGHGPALIEAQTYRFGGHSSSDDPKRYRTDADVSEWELRDPLRRIDIFLRGVGVDEEFFSELASTADDLAVQVRDQCKGLVGPELSDLFDRVYATRHPALEAEAAEHAELVASLRSGT